MLLYSWGIVCNEEFNVQFRVQSRRDAGQLVLRNTYYMFYQVQIINSLLEFYIQFQPLLTELFGTQSIIIMQ